LSNERSDGWRRASPLSAVFFVGKIGQALARNAFQSIAPVAAYAAASEGAFVDNAVTAVAVAMLLVIVAAVLRYLFFGFRIEDSSILIRDGIIRKTQLDIAFDRIQAIDTEQNFVYRPFGLVNIRFDTAGSSGEEGYLPAVPESLAQELEQRLEGYSPAYGQDEAAADGESATQAAPPTVLCRYTVRDLLRIGLTSNRAVILVAVAAPFFEPMFNRFATFMVGGDLSESAEQLFRGETLEFAGVMLAFGLLVTTALILASLAGAFLQYFGYELSVDGKRFRSVGGLLTRHERAMRFTKIQALYLYQNPLQRVFGIFRINVRQATSGKEAARRSFAIPLLGASGIRAVAGLSFDGEFRDADLDPRASDYVPVDRRFVRSQVVLKGVAPALLLGTVLLPLLGWAAGIALLWLPIAYLYQRQRYRVLGVRLNEDGLSIRSGLIGRRVIAHLHRKVQRVTIRQSPLQRRRQLATLKLFLASGAIRIPYLRQADAERLRDYILYRVESDRKAWH
jgi:putative membrane protein